MTRLPGGWRQRCPQLLTIMAVAAFIIPIVITTEVETYGRGTGAAAAEAVPTRDPQAPR
ncbi:hypothetical protein [Streptomyces sp. SA15]|uniref:hypothetical protein n=1 Tax=Streptomyces sp. SA15 TaxID=934019 RepID=UPI0015CC1E2D|nr:hypothetical protein [Streptomyces sp. SA15]